ncbi:MAG: SPOR domain-containing protein [Candidatus Schekmanbacteria bacterium]|nr:SPOR domain-containing protein [Candidatus Schekmanbacteria bacterium]
MSSKKFNFSFGFWQMALVLFALVMICGLTYSLGLMAGYKKSLIAAKKQLPPEDKLAHIIEDSQSVSFYETLPDGKTDSASPAPQIKKEEKKSPPPSISYQVQVGAFRKEKEAAALKERMAEKGYLVTVTLMQTPEKDTIYRVRVGNCATKEEAEALAKQIQDREHLPTLVVR